MRFKSKKYQQVPTQTTRVDLTVPLRQLSSMQYLIFCG